MLNRIRKIYVDSSVVEDKLTIRVLERAGDLPVRVVDKSDFTRYLSDADISKGKQILFITSTEGDLVRPCPGTLSPYLCCRYTTINNQIHCPMDCTYCILQDYLDRPYLLLYTNTNDLFKSVDKNLMDQPGRFFRFGTGELTDSLVLDSLTLLSQDLSLFFSTKRNCLIEFKTKTDCVKNLVENPQKNVVVSWSLNPQSIVNREEFFTSSLESRLEAARMCQERGLMLGFHFDPILYVPDWESLYQSVIDELFSRIDPASIVWISLGTLRYPPNLKKVIQKRFPKTKIIYEEMIRGLDGKMRYIRPLRTAMFRKIYELIRGYSDDLFVYLCMEPPWVWDDVMGYHPESNEELDLWFARSLYKRFPRLNMDEPAGDAYK